MRIRPKGVKKLLDELDTTLSQTVKYGKNTLQWNTIIQLKGQELASYLIGKRKTLDLSKPEPILNRVDTDNIRKKIMEITYGEWQNLGFSKGTLHQLKVKVKDNKSFSLNSHILERISALE
jgi:CRISPR-associated protein Cas1